MTIFVILGKLTHKAIEGIQGIAERDAIGEQIIKGAGGKLLSFYYSIGRYDFVAIVELPSQEALLKVLIEIGKWVAVPKP